MPRTVHSFTALASAAISTLLFLATVSIPASAPGALLAAPYLA